MKENNWFTRDFTKDMTPAMMKETDAKIIDVCVSKGGGTFGHIVTAVALDWTIMDVCRMMRIPLDQVDHFTETSALPLDKAIKQSVQRFRSIFLPLSIITKRYSQYPFFF